MAESSGYRNIEKANEAEEIASKVLGKFVLKFFEEFIQTRKSINDGTIREHHRRGRPAFTNRTKEDFEDPFQICKCYMPYGNSKVNSIGEANFSVLITVIFNFLPFKGRLSESLYIKVSEQAKGIHEGSSLTELVDYLNRIVQLMVSLKDEDQEDKSISRAVEKLEKIRRSLESSAVSSKAEHILEDQKKDSTSTKNVKFDESFEHTVSDEPKLAEDRPLSDSSTGRKPHAGGPCSVKLSIVTEAVMYGVDNAASNTRGIVGPNKDSTKLQIKSNAMVSTAPLEQGDMSGSFENGIVEEDNSTSRGSSTMQAVCCNCYCHGKLVPLKEEKLKLQIELLKKQLGEEEVYKL